MILHRLRLSNFRGVEDREISFPEHGVVVVCGPNEIGKSSMLEALDRSIRRPALDLMRGRCSLTASKPST